jgi:hypothetical protein
VPVDGWDGDGDLGLGMVGIWKLEIGTWEEGEVGVVVVIVH